MACLGIAAIAFWFALSAQDVKIVIDRSQHAVIAIPEFRGSGAAQPLMGAFNETLWADIETSGQFRMAPRSMYPTTIPQQPSDFRDHAAVDPGGAGLRMQDWSAPPVSANYLAFGYTAVQDNILVLYGWLFDLRGGSPAAAQVIASRYVGSVDQAGARKVAHEFAADIITRMGGKTLLGTHIYFVSDRTGHKEIWVMDPDGSNQRQITRLKSISIEPAVSPDGDRIAFTSYAKSNPKVFVFSVSPVRDLRFANQEASLSSSPSFTPDGKQIVYSSSAGTGKCCRILIADLEGTGLRPISGPGYHDTEPKVNPRTGADIVFSSNRAGPEQIYRMNIDGASVERLTPGVGEAANPSWHPDGQRIAYTWTRGYAAGSFNIFVMDLTSRDYVQLTQGQGRNEHPSWAEDGRHIVFDSTRNGKAQIWTMLADGTQLRQLTTTGRNDRPVWGR